MRKYYYILLLGLVLLSSCEKVSQLSDDAEIVSFTIKDQTEGIILNKDNITINDHTVSIPLDFGRKLFPLAINAEIKFSSTTDKVISVDDSPLNLQEIIFNDVYTPQTFYLISESGVPHLGQIVLKDKPNADITNFQVIEPEEGVSVSIRDNNIRISFEEEIDWTEPQIIKADITHTGEIKTGSASSPFEFNSSNDKKQITLIADNGDERIWNIQIVPTIENAKFEHWIDEGSSKINIDPMPGKGLGWATANNSFVQGTTPVPNQKGFAAQLQTGIQNLSGLGIGELITAGTIFTGYFKMNISALNNPPLMTYFGIPFIMRPKSISVDAKYEAGPKFQQSEKVGQNSYKIKDLTGVDQGRIWVELLRWEGNGPLEYHGDPVEGLKLLGKGEIIFDGANTSLRNWQTHTIPIKYESKYRDLEPTHISIVMTSSRQGDLFIGAKGSTLTVDNVVVNF